MSSLFNRLATFRADKRPTYQYTPAGSPDNTELGPSKDGILIKSSKGMISMFLLLSLTFLAPLVTLIVWWFCVVRPNDLALWQSASIGGSFTQINAKTIDLIAGILIAPLAMASINFIWFRWVRTVVSSEHPEQQKPVSMTSMLELSITSAGSYDLVKLWRLLRATRVRYSLTAALVLFSAIAASLFVNFVAYEAFPTAVSFENSANSSLRYMSDRKLSLMNATLEATTGMEAFGRLSQSTLAAEYTNLLHNVYYGNYRNESGEGWFEESQEIITANATLESLELLDGQIQQLWDVPAYQQSISCRPAAIENFTISNTNIAGQDYRVYMRALARIPGRANITTMDAYVGSNVKEFDGSIENHPISALLYEENFDSDNAEILLVDGYIVRWIASQPLPPASQVPTRFGNITCSNYRQPDVIPDAPNGARKVELCGLACKIQRQTGFVNLTTTENKRWNIISQTFNGTLKDVPSPLSVMQSALDYRTPTQYKAMSGAGAALAARNSTATYNFDMYAQKLLYASTKFNNLLYNIALSSNEDRKAQAATYPVSGLHSVLKYRITYIPGILLGGLLSLIVSSSIVLAISVYSLNTLSVQKGRVVDGLRFVVDFTSAVQQELDLKNGNAWERKELEDWARRTKTQYVLDDNIEHIHLRCQVDEPTEKT